MESRGVKNATLISISQIEKVIKISTINLQNVRDEICQFLRRNDVLTTTVRGITRTASSYAVGVGGETTHTFTGNIPTRDFRTLTVDGATMLFLRDYTMNWNTGALTWNTPLTNGQAVVYSIDWGTGDKIYPDLPRDDINLQSFPRVGIELTSITTNPIGLGGMTHLSDMLITIHVWAPVNKSADTANYGGLQDLEETHRLIREAFRTGAKTFTSFTYITPSGVNPLFKGKNDKLLGQSADYRVKFRFE